MKWAPTSPRTRCFVLAPWRSGVGDVDWLQESNNSKVVATVSFILPQDVWKKERQRPSRWIPSQKVQDSWLVPVSVASQPPVVCPPDRVWRYWTVTLASNKVAISEGVQIEKSIFTNMASDKFIVNHTNSIIIHAKGIPFVPENLGRSVPKRPRPSLRSQWISPVDPEQWVVVSASISCFQPTRKVSRILFRSAEGTDVLC